VNDPGSLQNLNDIVLPEAVAWWPPAPGWYAVLAVLLVLLLWLSFRALKAWRRNTYRRQALREFSAIRKRGQSAAGDIPLLLKRAALSAWPRSGVASLSGAEWHEFLDRTAPEAKIAEIGDMLDRVSYFSSSDRELGGAEFDCLCDAAEHWLRRHRVEEA
jgi:hypothetical protein